MESIDTGPRGAFDMMLLELLEVSGAGDLNTGLAEEKEEEDEHGGEDCAAEWDEGSGRF